MFLFNVVQVCLLVVEICTSTVGTDAFLLVAFCYIVKETARTFNKGIVPHTLLRFLVKHIHYLVEWLELA